MVKSCAWPHPIFLRTIMRHDYNTRKKQNIYVSMLDSSRNSVIKEGFGLYSCLENDVKSSVTTAQLRRRLILSLV